MDDLEVLIPPKISTMPFCNGYRWLSVQFVQARTTYLVVLPEEPEPSPDVEMTIGVEDDMVVTSDTTEIRTNTTP